MNQWILLLYNDKTDHIILLMVVEQPTNNKIIPVIDFCELNQFLECYTGDDVIDNSDKTLRERSQISADPSIAAYLQIEIFGSIK